MASRLRAAIQDHRTRLDYANAAHDRAVERVVKGRMDARSQPGVMRASGMRIFSMAAEKLRMLAGNRQPWQTLAWSYRDMIGELRFALQFRARAISRVVFCIAQIQDGEDEPIPVSLRNDDDPGKAATITVSAELCAAAEAELARLPLNEGYSFTGVWSENQDVAGDCWLHGRINPETGQEEWRIRSVMDVDTQGNSMTIKNELGQPRRLDLGTGPDDPGTEEIFRLWVPHPAHGHLADSAFIALMDTFEDITLIGREIRAAARSRISANGVWMVPNGMSLPKNTRDDTDEAEDGPSQFMINLQAAFLAPISNEGDPGAVVPAVIFGSREDIEVAKDSFIRFTREDSPTLLDKLDKCLGRMGNSLDIPPEIITGMADVNHWTAWQIDAATFRHYLEPSIRLMVDSLTVGYLRQGLIAQGFAPAEVARLRVWYDAGQITENPNRRQDALDARDRGALGDAAFREALGFNDGDKPTAEEQLLMIALKSGIDPATAAAILASWAKQEGTEFPVAAPAPRSEIGPAAPAQPPAAAPDATGPGGTGAPTTAPDGIAASGHLADLLMAVDPIRRATPPPIVAAAARADREPYRLDTDTGNRLMEIERALRTELLSIADGATTRALERAGSRLRAKATRDPALTASLREHHVTTWPARVGRQQSLGLGADARFLLAQAWEQFGETFTRKVGHAIGDVVDWIAAKLLAHLPEAQREASRAIMNRAMASRVRGALANLMVGLERNAEQLMFDEHDNATDLGELPDMSVPPILIRTALAEIGGLPETSGGLHNGRVLTGEPLGGLATGTIVAGELDAAGVLAIGYLWVYGVTPQLRKFQPHWELEGERFTSWADEKLHTPPAYTWCGPFFTPGDHRGCMCDYVTGYAVPEYASLINERLSVPSQSTQWVLDLAATDDAAGRNGTTAQAMRDQHTVIQRLQSRFMEGAFAVGHGVTMNDQHQIQAAATPSAEAGIPPADIPGWEGAVGPFPDDYSQPHIYARDIHSGAGNCVCGGSLGDSLHVQAAPGVDVPERMRT